MDNLWNRPTPEWVTPEPGVYLDMPFEDYLRIPCLNSSAIKDILISPSHFWWGCPWMNPIYDEVQEEETQAQWKTDGTAYHKRVFEGKEKFYNTYAPDLGLDKEDPSVLVTIEDLRGALSLRGLPVAGKTKSALIERLLVSDPSVKIYDVMMSEHRRNNPVKTLLPEKILRRIEQAAAMIDNHTELRRSVVGGFPEVTVIWDDKKYGVRFKARFDYMKIGEIVDMKTYSNFRGEKVSQAISREIGLRLYLIQAYLYLSAAEAAKEFLASGKCDQPIRPDWARLYQKTPVDIFRFLFVQKGSRPTVSGAYLSTKDRDFMEFGEGSLLTATTTFKEYFKKFGRDPWVDDSPSQIVTFSDVQHYMRF